MLQIPPRQAVLPRPFWKRCARRAMRRRPRSRPASALRSVLTMRRIVSHFSPTPIPRSTGPRPKAATPIAFSRPGWVPRFANAECSNTICVTRSCATSCDWCISPSRKSRAGKLSASKHCYAGSTQCAAIFHRPFSSRLQRRPELFCRLETGY